ncbi:MAG: bifunctional diguanylate cyclase/phosphodiesterase [Spirochaetales bacterium]|nr:bifunctional diguanylate cyclase/phosphodiesterase [Spirochaetales bacterium]
MGLLRTTESVYRETNAKNLWDELSKARLDLVEERRINHSLRKQVNGLLHYINEQNQLNEDLRMRISLNPKTGLPNHTQLDVDLQEYFEQLTHDSKAPSGAVILIKLDENYDIITKTLKPSVSEWVLYQISTRLQELATEMTPLFHTRDDEFILVVPGAGEPEKLQGLLDDICRIISHPHIFSGYHITINCLVGVAFYPMNGSTKSTLLNNADIALNHAKATGKGHVFYTEKMREDVVEKMHIQNSIIRALEEQPLKEIGQQFYINLQPIVTVNALVDGLPEIDRVDAEALIRWKHPENGNISPEDFIPIAEETGLIIIIGKWVLYNATAQIESWQNTHHLDSRLAINVSPRQFKNDELLDSVRRIIGFRNINPECLQVEITENSFLEDPAEAVRKIFKLKDLGISIAIDDFGTGFSSVNYLRKLPVDVVKIDRSFITDIATNTQDRNLVKAMVAMIQELGLSSVVEGVENLDQLKILMDMGLQRFQGYYFSKPLMPADYLSYHRRNCPKPSVIGSEQSQDYQKIPVQV